MRVTASPSSLARSTQSAFIPALDLCRDTRPIRQGCSITDGWTDGKARLTFSTRWPCCENKMCASMPRFPALGRILTPRSSCAGQAFPGRALLRLCRLRRTPALYRTADVFVSPTYAEGFSNTILEAMARPAHRLLSCGRRRRLPARRRERPVGEPGDVPALAVRSAAGDRGRGGCEAAWPVRRCRSAGKHTRGRRSGDRSWKCIPRCTAEAPDTGFEPVLPIDPACRFRAAPHLL